jgi:predicted GNAT family N-acyltransferase
MAGFIIHETGWTHDAERLSAIRRAVFIDEQGVPEALEWDEHDADALHLLATLADGTPIGCARLLPDGHIGRMAVLPAWRGRGAGRALLAAASRAAQSRGYTTLKLSAQIHAAGFYSAAGFIAVGEPYEEAGIPHVAMQMNLR